MTTSPNDRELPITLAAWAVPPSSWLIVPADRPTMDRHRVRGIGYVTTLDELTCSAATAEARHDDSDDRYQGGSNGGSRVGAPPLTIRPAPARGARALVVPNRRRALIGAVSSLLTFTTLAGTALANPASAASTAADQAAGTPDTAASTGADPSATTTSTTLDPSATIDPTTGLPVAPAATTASTVAAPASGATTSPTTVAAAPVTSAPSVSTATTSAPSISPAAVPTAPSPTTPSGTTPASTGPGSTAPASAGPVGQPSAASPIISGPGVQPATPSTGTTTSVPVITGVVMPAAITFEPQPGQVAPVAALPEAATKAPAIGDAVALPTDDRPLDPVAGAAQLAATRHTAAIAAHHRVDSLTEESTAIDQQLVVVSATLQTLTERAFLVPAAEAGPVVAQRQAASATKQQLDEARALVQMQLVMAQGEVVEDDRANDEARTRLAKLVGDRLGAGAEALDAAWQATAPMRLDVVYAALAQVGDPYVWAAVGPDAFDCSGLTMFAWATVGVHLTHYTHAQRAETLDAAPDQLQPGDLIYNLSADGTGHVMLSLGPDHAIVEAPRPGTTVTISRWTDATGFGSPLDDRPTVLEAVTVSAG